MERNVDALAENAYQEWHYEGLQERCEELERRCKEMENLVRRVARLNAKAGEIGAGMLASLVEEAQRIQLKD